MDTYNITNTKDKRISTCFTGHRILSSELVPRITEYIDSSIDNRVKDGCFVFYTGGAIGFDALAAWRVLAAKRNRPFIELILALPCRDQTNRWRAQLDLELYQAVKGDSDSICHVGGFYDGSIMKARNRFMVDNSSCCIAYVTRKGSGSASTLSYAAEKGLKLINVADLL